MGKAARAGSRQRELMSLPLTSTLARLPRWALVAFGVRTARRLDNDSLISKDSEAASENAILLAERSAALARAFEVDDAIQAARQAAKREFDEVNSDADSDYARAAAARPTAAYLAAMSVKDPKPDTVSKIIDEVSYDLGASVEKDISQDFQLLANAAADRHWDDHTAVAPHFFATAQRAAGLVLQAVRALSDRLSRLVAEDPNALDALEWRDLERMLATVFDGLGFNVELTPASKDGGKDIVLKYSRQGYTKTYVVEVKHWRSRKLVGRKELTAFVQVVAKEKRDGGLFLATYGYSETTVEAITEIDREAVYMGEKPHIVALCRSYERQRNGIWAATAPLHELLHRDLRRLTISTPPRNAKLR